MGNLSTQSSIQDEINSNLKELITINKLQSLNSIFLYNETNEFQKKLLTELINSNKQQSEMNKQQSELNKQQSEMNKLQREHNKTLEEILKKAFPYPKDIKNSKNSNNN